MAETLMATLKEPIAQVAAADLGLAEYLRRASCQLTVALSEARWHEGGPAQAALLRQAGENVSEVYAALQLAESWGHVGGDAIVEARKLLDLQLELLTSGGAEQWPAAAKAAIAAGRRG